MRSKSTVQRISDRKTDKKLSIERKEIANILSHQVNGCTFCQAQHGRDRCDLQSTTLGKNWTSKSTLTRWGKFLSAEKFETLVVFFSRKQTKENKTAMSILYCLT